MPPERQHQADALLNDVSHKKPLHNMRLRLAVTGCNNGNHPSRNESLHRQSASFNLRHGTNALINDSHLPLKREGRPSSRCKSPSPAECASIAEKLHAASIKIKAMRAFTDSLHEAVCQHFPCYTPHFKSTPHVDSTDCTERAAGKHISMPSNQRVAARGKTIHTTS